MGDRAAGGNGIGNPDVEDVTEKEQGSGGGRKQGEGAVDEDVLVVEPHGLYALGGEGKTIDVWCVT